MDLRERFLPRHVLAQVVAEALPVVGRYPILKNSTAINNCISSTRIAKLVCDHYGVPARGIACSVLLWNKPMNDRFAARGAVRPPTSLEEGEAWKREDGSFARGIGIHDTPADELSWPGHCVLVVNEEWIVDMSLDQGQDPFHGIEPEPVTFPVPPEFWDGIPAVFQHTSGIGMLYQFRPDKPPFDDTPAWCDLDLALPPIVAEIVQELDALDPQTIIRSSAWAK